MLRTVVIIHDIHHLNELANFKFLENHAYDHRRLTLVRYESLALTKPEHKLTMMTSLDAPGSNRISKTEVDEYIITSQVSIIQIIRRKVKTSHFDKVLKRSPKY